jgi:hypothetical protein
MKNYNKKYRIYKDNNGDAIETVHKSITTGDMDVSGVKGGLLPPEQEKAFIMRVFAVSGFSGHSQQQVISPNDKYINSLSVSGRVTRPAAENTGPDSYASVNFGQRKVNTEEFRVDWYITKEALSRNLEKQALANTVQNAMAIATNNDREEIMVSGDTTSTDDFLNQLDGLLKLGIAGGETIDMNGLNGGSTNTAGVHTIFAKLYRGMPQKFKTAQYRQLLRYYAHPDVIDDFVNSLQQRATTLGDTALSKNEAGLYTYKGIPLVPIDSMPTNLTATGAVSVGGSKTAVILTHSDNIVTYIEGAYVNNSPQGVSLYTEFNKDKNRFEWVMYLSYGFDYFFPEQVIVGVNVAIKTISLT